MPEIVFFFFSYHFIYLFCYNLVLPLKMIHTYRLARCSVQFICYVYLIAGVFSPPSNYNIIKFVFYSLYNKRNLGNHSFSRLNLVKYTVKIKESFSDQHPWDLRNREVANLFCMFWIFGSACFKKISFNSLSIWEDMKNWMQTINILLVKYSLFGLL